MGSHADKSIFSNSALRSTLDASTTISQNSLELTWYTSSTSCEEVLDYFLIKLSLRNPK